MSYLSIEIYKTLHCLNPQYLKKLFQLNESKYSSRRSLDLTVPRVNQTRYVDMKESESGTTYQIQLNPLKIYMLNVSSKPGKVPAAIAFFANLFLQIKFLAISSSYWVLSLKFYYNLDYNKIAYEIKILTNRDRESI